MIGDGGHLLVVASGALTSIPLHLLVTKPADAAAANFRDLSWLAAEHPISVLPSAASLGSLRRTKPSQLAS